MWQLWIYLSIAFALHTRVLTQTESTTFHSPDIELSPYFVLAQAPQSVNFVCSHHGSDDALLEYRLSKNISSKQIEISSRRLNQTSIHIRLEINDYIGIFHLLCYRKGDQHQGTRADVIVKAFSGVLQLQERCRVYDRQFIKCVIRAPAISRAIENNYPATIYLDEFTHSDDAPAFKPKFEFLKNESTQGVLVFKWKPTVEGQFPPGVRMRLRVVLPHFNDSIYIFDMTPIYSITPNFTVKAVASDEIKIELNPSLSPMLCEKSIQDEANQTMNRTWTLISTNRNGIVVGDLRSSSFYRVCMRCRERFADPQGVEQCQLIKTWNPFSVLSGLTLIVISAVALAVVVALVLFVVVFVLRRRRSAFKQIEQDDTSMGYQHQNTYEHERSVDESRDLTRNPNFLHDVSEHHVEFSNAESSDNGKRPDYVVLAGLASVIDMCDSPKILKPPDSTDQ